MLHLYWNILFKPVLLYGFEKTRKFTWIVWLSLGITALFLVRFVIMLIYNKNLILKELFIYFVPLRLRNIPLLVALKLII